MLCGIGHHLKVTFSGFLPMDSASSLMLTRYRSIGSILCAEGQEGVLGREPNREGQVGSACLSRRDCPGAVHRPLLATAIAYLDDLAADVVLLPAQKPCDLSYRDFALSKSSGSDSPQQTIPLPLQRTT
jgi:hypothetical protein